MRLLENTSQGPILLVSQPEPDATPPNLNRVVEGFPGCLVAPGIAALGFLSDTGGISEGQARRKPSLARYIEAAMPSETAEEFHIDVMLSNALFALLCCWCLRLRERSSTGTTDFAGEDLSRRNQRIRFQRLTHEESEQSLIHKGPSF